MMDTDFPSDVTVLYTDTRMVGADGKEVGLAEGVYSHHVVFIASSKMDTEKLVSCNGRRLNVPTIPVFAGAAAENVPNSYAIKNATINTGYYLPKGEKIFLDVDVVNSKESDIEIYIESEVEYLLGKAEGYLDSDSFIISPSTCDSAAGVMGGTYVKPPPGQQKFSFKGSDITMEQNGYIVWSRKSNSFSI
jgi:hypothetical protein